MTESSIVIPQEDESLRLVKSKSLMTIQRKSPVYTIILRPHNSNFQLRTIELRDKTHLKIGRQTNAKTTPNQFNGYFDSKVLSRQHAEIWCDKSRVYIKDVKSSNGTFVNGQRLSNECEESAPVEIKNYDEVEFGIDIVNDNGSIMYHKVSCSIHIFPMSLSQVDENIIRELADSDSAAIPLNDVHLHRKLSSSSINTILGSNQDLSNGHSPPNGTKRIKRLESILNKLHDEMDKSKRVENELKTIKDTMLDINTVFNEEKLKKNDELLYKLQEAEDKIRNYDEKWKYQNQAIQSAKKELHRMENELTKSYNSRENILKELTEERRRRKRLEEHIRLLNQQRKREPTTLLEAFQVRGIQLLFAVLIGVISTLFYVLYS
ncbi:SMAD/FHA domain-containing protein [Pilobolus umbonatus]|nr:SMAD/FHA domain-containing protein [Pilobolus umbonatus]